MNAAILATFDRLEPAETLKSRLEQSGIHAVVHDESRLQRFGFMTKPAATKKVEVPCDDLSKAKTLLDAWDRSDGVLKHAIRCPQCNSPRVEYPQFTRKFIVPIVVELFVSMGLFEKDFYCQDCHFTWPKETRIEPERDILDWPVKNDGKRDRAK
jgi:hypothetical protein